ncbi:hypothetical protein [Embleya sp. NPDC059237]|uniref:hypothetical protein n=1 Tax=Embleya sp. NPDC059237 TaxID=3346784 RepID=UPI0036960E45
MLPHDGDQQGVFVYGQVARVEGDQFGDRRVAGVPQEYQRTGAHAQRRGAIVRGHHVTRTVGDKTIEPDSGDGIRRRVGPVGHRTFVPDSAPEIIRVSADADPGGHGRHDAVAGCCDDDGAGNVQHTSHIIPRSPPR